ncbi:hypothetical protein [Bradyrhizobium sp. AUGA SZCCT0431]|uniref:hypothetical protein n=1 Tax=Bradyrhizobium sp. AUGA SZCCT0431 TaxID=2807674 RepID=UPI001BA4D754|nr:hypothetical protein [Bradyrhizobium sp. AUGA SZCCT0431]MBR1147367.1 hypothetical protein [Bradyrhizobium sp. AUGA SZCCT0431]
MKRLIIASLLIAGVVVLWMTAFPSVTVRYRLTLDARVDGELKTASSVREVTYSKQSGFASQQELRVRYRGEAIALDLGSRGTLFALLTKDTDDRSGAEWIVLRAFGFSGGSLPRPVEEGLKEVSRLSGKRELPLDGLPMLVRFRDMNDPKTVVKVDPIDIGRSFGDGTKLVRATLEIVPVGIWPLNSVGIAGEPITTGIEKRLSWLAKHYDIKFDGQRFETISASLRLANSLASGAFKAGF